jgi:nucleoside-diphosphate-sugar epimerase
VKIFVTGSAGFICGYLVEALLASGYSVIGLDNFSKYGRIEKSYSNHPNFRFVEGDAKNIALLKELLIDCDHFVAAAAMIGGISYFHELAYDLLAENERLTAAAFDAAIYAHSEHKLQKITVMSSSMVFENTCEFPTPEDAVLRCPPPSSTYGYQKLATEYFARGAFEQYGLPYTIVRPFNCAGIGERRALRDHEIKSGNVKLAMSHVIPDLVQKALKGQDPLHILGSGRQARHYTYGADLARGIQLAIERPAALNEDFNLSTAEKTTVLELAELIWRKIHGNSKPFRYECDPPYKYDVQERSPDTSKAARLLGFIATTKLPEILDEVIPWVQSEIFAGKI